MSDLMPVRLQEIIPEAADTYTYRFELPPGFTWEAGANAHLVAREISTFSAVEKDWRRHMSIMNTPDEGYLGFTTRVREPRSPFKTSLLNTVPGDTLHIYGNKNNFPLIRDGRPTVLLSMGVGMATMRPLIRSFMKNRQGLSSLTSINVDRCESGVYQAEMESLDVSGFTQIYKGNRQSFLDEVDRCLQMKDARYYLVGSDEFLSSIAYYLIGSGIPRSQLMIDKKPHKVQAILDAI